QQRAVQMKQRRLAFGLCPARRVQRGGALGLAQRLDGQGREVEFLVGAGVAFLDHDLDSKGQTNRPRWTPRPILQRLSSTFHCPLTWKARHPVGLPSTSDCTYCSLVLRLKRITAGRPSGSRGGADSR